MTFIKGQKSWNKGRNNKIKKICQFCKGIFFTFPSEDKRRGGSKFCGRKCFGKFLKKSRLGKNNPCYRGGKHTDKGYIWILNPSHPFATKSGYVYEHRLAMEKYLGRYLKPMEVIHHINGNHADNKISNLQLFAKNKEHMKLHYLNRHKSSN